MVNSNLFIAQYYQYQHCLNIEQGVNLWHLLNQALLMGVEGDIIEVGSLTGMTSAVIQKTLEDFGSNKKLYIYDSFEGLSQLTANDLGCPLIPENFKTIPDHTINRFETFGLKQPIIINGWINDTLPGELPNKIAFAHIDLDLYEPTKYALECIYPLLSKNSIVIIDDYSCKKMLPEIEKAYNYNPYNKHKISLSDYMPGVGVAVDEFINDKEEDFVVLIAREEKHGYFRKK